MSGLMTSKTVTQGHGRLLAEGMCAEPKESTLVYDDDASSRPSKPLEARKYRQQWKATQALECHHEDVQLRPEGWRTMSRCGEVMCPLAHSKDEVHSQAVYSKER
jgi:hypothetical protein